MDALSVTEAKARLLELIRSSDEGWDRHVLTRNGRPVAVLMSFDEYEGWVETLDILGEKSALAEIRKAQREIDQGKGLTPDEVFGRPARPGSPGAPRPGSSGTPRPGRPRS